MSLRGLGSGHRCAQRRCACVPVRATAALRLHSFWPWKPLICEALMLESCCGAGAAAARAARLQATLELQTTPHRRASGRATEKGARRSAAIVLLWVWCAMAIGSAVVRGVRA